MSDMTRLSVKPTPVQVWTGPDDSYEVVVPRFHHDNRDIRLVRLSALRTGRLYPPSTHIPGTHRG
jgi:hypothetical protein